MSAVCSSKGNGDQRRPMGRKAREGLYVFLRFMLRSEFAL